VVLTEGAAETAAALSFAAAVAVSRVHVGAHHASDVVGGALIGTATGLVVRRLLRGALAGRDATAE
jgi:membrane-associated phospholipid phosphatase